jgi:pyrroloquinoline quinone (PQQ) biosynthesis protein C
MNTSIEGLLHARKVARWAGIGVMPSQENALRAQGALQGFMQGENGDAADPRTALRVVGSIAMGIAPSQEMCDQAEHQITQALDVIRDADTNALRASFRQRN